MRLLLIILSFQMISVFGQENPILNYFSANLLNDQVYLSLEIKGGSQCNGITIFRSTDSLNYEEIGSIPGLCGSPDFAQAYEFTDPNPVPNAHNYYKVELGSQGFSSVAEVHYVELFSEGYKVYPNPITQDSRLYLKDRDEDYAIEFYMLNGQKVATYHLDQSEQYVDLHAFNFPASMITFRASSENGSTISGKFVVP